MRFSFEYDMQKGQCFKCPFLVDYYYNDGHWCSLNKCDVTLETDADECPLKEEKQ